MQKTKTIWQRYAYIFVLYCAVTLVPLYLLWRARRQPEYARGWAERFAWSYGKLQRSKASRRVWLHAVSLGETRAAQPLIDMLLQNQSDIHIILTHTTPTGRAAGSILFAAYLKDGRMTQVYVPYDLPDAVARFLKHFSPTDCWLMETEIWPNIIAACTRRRIPVSLLNGRLSDKTLSKTLKNSFVAQLFRATYAQLHQVYAQSELDAARYKQLGVVPERIQVTGNLKFDMSIPDELVSSGERLQILAKQLAPSRKIVLLASTRENEESMWLNALENFKNDDIQWWLVPRHPQRFNEVANLLHQSGFFGESLMRKTELDRLCNEEQRSQCLQNAKIILGDTMGEMFTYYAIADVVLMGGAWQAHGGQNFLEPLALGKPVIIGPHTFNFAQITQDAVQANALIQVTNITQGLQQVERLLANPQISTAQQQSAQRFYRSHHGTAQKILSSLM